MNDMNKMKTAALLLFVLILGACSGGKDSKKAENGLHQVTVKEVIQTSKYTYLKVAENGSEQWMAVPLTDARENETLYYASGFEMKNFESKELKRTFESILFVDRISKDPEAFNKKEAEEQAADAKSPEQSELTGPIALPAGAVRIADLYSRKKDLKGKMVMVRGKVTKANTGIMGTNWYHIEDGTSDGSRKDLTVTSDDFLNAGDTVTFEGQLVLDKDIGSGYFFELLLEKARVK